MRAAVCPVHGGPDVVRTVELPVPEPADGEALVRVDVAAVNFPDVLLIAGRYQVDVRPPFVPGSEYAGTVVAVRGDVGDLAVGDRVTGTGLVGAFAERVAAPAATLRRIPDGMTAATAAAAGVAHRTAHHALRSTARIAPGDRLLVLGAGGGVGLAAVQLGAAMGARVTAVASTAEKLATATRYGAEITVRHGDGDLRELLRAAVPDGHDAALDPVGGALAEPALRTLRRGGRFVTVGFASGVIPRIPLNLVLVKGVRILGFQFQDVPADEFARTEADLAELLASGQVTPHVGAVYPLDDAATALRHVADGRAVGKVLIRVGT